MGAYSIIEACRSAGLSIRMGGAGTLLVTPAARITSELRALIRDYKSDLLLALAVPAADPYDDRVTCQTCRNLWPGNYCLTHRKAGLDTRDLPAEFTTLMQRCPAYAPLARPEAGQ